jgi:hypothetical protein
LFSILFQPLRRRERKEEKALNLGGIPAREIMEASFGEGSSEEGVSAVGEDSAVSEEVQAEAEEPPEAGERR